MCWFSVKIAMSVSYGVFLPPPPQPIRNATSHPVSPKFGVQTLPPHKKTHLKLLLSLIYCFTWKYVFGIGATNHTIRKIYYPQHVGLFISFSSSFLLSSSFCRLCVPPPPAVWPWLVFIHLLTASQVLSETSSVNKRLRGLSSSKMGDFLFLMHPFKEEVYQISTFL